MRSKLTGSGAGIAIILSLVLLNSHEAVPGKSLHPEDCGKAVAAPQAIGVLGIDRPLWAPNRISTYLSNRGQLVSPVAGPGMEWPAGSGNHIVFASGFWLAGTKNGEVVTAAGEYTAEFQPGTVSGDSPGHAGTPADFRDPRFKVYVINEGDGGNPSGNPDYVNWPAADGAPVDANGDPLLLGTSTAWAVFNDFNDTLHTRLFDTKPMGVEVQMTAWAYDRQDAFGDMMFFKFIFINKSGANIANAFAGLWTDIDIGVGYDLVGCDTTLALGYQYKTQVDTQYGENPPAIGYKLLQGPVVPSPGDTALVSGGLLPGFENLSMTSFRKFVCGGPPEVTCPMDGLEVYDCMKGLSTDGQSIVNPTTGQRTTFWHPGDPVSGTGWLDSQSGDRYFLLSSGPFAFAAGDTQEVVCAVIIAQGTTALESVQLLKQHDRLAQMAYDDRFVITGVTTQPALLPEGYLLLQNYPNPFNPSTVFEFALPRDGFVSLTIFNLLGEEVSTILAERRAAGRHKVGWNASGLSSGVYFYRFQAGDFVQVKKLLLVQ